MKFRWTRSFQREAGASIHSLSDIAGGDSRVLRDAAFDRTDFATAPEGRVLVYAATAAFLDRAAASPAVAAVVTRPELADRIPEHLGVAIAPDPEMAFWRMHNRLAAERGMRVAVEPFIDPSARIHPDAHVSPGCRIGPDVVVEARAVIHAGTVLEAGVHVREEAILGAEGMMCKRRPGLVLQPAHVGGVHVGEGAHVFTRAVVQRAPFADFTRIGPRVVLSSESIVGHGTSVGADTTIAFRAAVAGFSRIGARVSIGPNATVSNLLEIGDDARVEIGALVVRSVPAGARYSGLFARPHAKMRRMSVALAKLAGRGAD